ncbi:MAG: RidA family protein [Candidatus Handelsmanbacteria bacterium]|nr:RidA family protein [Candidatus Handelsmanbacteria bacterium]
MSTFEEIKTNNPAHQGWPYSEAVRAGDFIFVAGIGAEDETTGQLVGETIEEQTRFVFSKIARILSHAGAGLRQVCRVSVHLKDIGDFQAFSDTYARIFSWEPKPTRITRQSGLWPGLLIEVECTAYQPAPKGP